jgi:tetratricopeptide (TPR) repeat protein
MPHVLCGCAALKIEPLLIPQSMKPSLLIIFVLLIGAGIAWVVFGPSYAPPVKAARSVVMRPPYDPTLTTKNITFYEKQIKLDALDALSPAKLAGFYLQRCRETGDIADADRAEKAARLSLKRRSKNNNGAYGLLAQSLSTQHRFKEALKIAEETANRNPGDPQAKRLRSELYIELGDYNESEAVLREGKDRAEDAGLKTLRARLLEINGQPEPALRLLREAQAEADKNFDLPRENTAWFHVRVGDLLTTMGRLEDAEKSYNEAVEIYPRDYKAFYGLARVAASRKQWEAVITWGQKAADIVPMPETVALIGDAYAARGDAQNARRQYDTVEAIGRLAKAQGTIYDRQRALFLADHNRNLDEALTFARNELKVRQDIYAYDTLAWAYYKKGLAAEADQAIKKALARGTKDARLLYHASEIARLRHDETRANTLMVQSRALNPSLYNVPQAAIKTASLKN